jgi:uncharacterized protein
MADAGEDIAVEVVYALPGRSWRIGLRVPPGCSVGEAVERSGLRASVPQLAVDDAHIGIFSRPVTLSTALRAGDRVEIYRPLRCDPKEVRRQRAAKTR